MTTLLLSHSASLRHETPHGHPERADRIRAIDKRLADPRFASLARQEAPLAELEVAALAHPREYVDAIAKVAPTEGTVAIDGDTVMSPGTMQAIRRGVGGAVAAVDAVISGAAKNAFSAMRPPGHHAEKYRAMGFCLFNNAAVAARHAQKAHGIGRVAVIDWDVHHGNGTQDIFWSDASVMYVSTHQMPLYPGTGAASERGDHDTIVNAPLRPGDGSERFRDAFESLILPRLEAYAPELVIISAGFDAHWRDPLANLQLNEEDFGWATRRLMEIADRHSGGRVVSVLEGGYDLQGLSDSVDAHLTALMEA